MRRAAAWVAVCLPALAHAGTTVTAEGGAEVDTNVRRVETLPDRPVDPVRAPLVRVGAKLDTRGRLVGGSAGLALSALGRVVLGERTSDTRGEDQFLLIADARWLRPVGQRAVSVGAALTAVDLEPLGNRMDARTFRTLGADGLLVLRGNDDRALSFAIGWRAFAYKPEGKPASYHDLDWRGPAATARLDLTLWEPAGGTRSLELAVMAGFEDRSFESAALASACPDMRSPPIECYAGTTMRRRDRYQRAGMELIWTGRVIAAAGYQVGTIDSNSYGQSLVRHRITASATTGLGWRVVGTLLGTLQIDQYLDGLPIETDTQLQTFTTLDDENRSSLQLRLGRPLTSSWSIEGRGAIWRNLGSTLDATFRRGLVYVGAIFTR